MILLYISLAILLAIIINLILGITTKKKVFTIISITLIIGIILLWLAFWEYALNKNDTELKSQFSEQSDSKIYGDNMIKNTTIQGIVELHHNGHIYIFGGQHFGELGYEIEEYTSSYINDTNQTCIDYITLNQYDTSYIEEGDLIICTGDLKQKGSHMDGDFDTKDNPIIVLKSKDYNKMKQNALNGNGTIAPIITVGDMYITEGYMYLKYDIEDKTHSEKAYHFPFIQKAYITNTTEVTEELKKGKNVKVEYNELNNTLDGLEIKSIQIIEINSDKKSEQEIYDKIKKANQEAKEIKESNSNEITEQEKKKLKEEINQIELKLKELIKKDAL